MTSVLVADAGDGLQDPIADRLHDEPRDQVWITARQAKCGTAWLPVFQSIQERILEGITGRGGGMKELNDHGGGRIARARLSRALRGRARCGVMTQLRYPDGRWCWKWRRWRCLRCIDKHHERGIRLAVASAGSRRAWNKDHKDQDDVYRHAGCDR